MPSQSTSDQTSPKLPLSDLNNKPKDIQNTHSDDDDDDYAEYAPSEFGEFGKYMAAKKSKLQRQALETMRSHTGGRLLSRVFVGCTIYINGYTGPDHSEEQLRRLIVAHGGRAVQHMSRKGDVSHIVATGLTASKRVEYKNMAVVVPRWVDACIEAGVLLDWKEYRTIPVDLTRGQTTLAPLKNNTTQQQQQHDAIPSIADPAFISHFYAHSRLHHLSMWKAALRHKHLAAAAAELAKAPSSLAAPPLQSPSQRVILHIDYDCFFAAVSALKCNPPVPPSVPAAVTSGSHAKSDIASANYAARKFGVRNGMLLQTARARCPDLRVLQYDFPAYAQASEAMYDTLHAARAGPVCPISVDEALLDASEWVAAQTPSADEDQIERIATTLANTLRAQIRAKTGLETSVGIGPSGLLARAALAQAKPAGVRCVPWSARIACLAGSLPGFSPISLSDLPGLGPNIVSRLHAAPLRIKSYAALSRFARGLPPEEPDVDAVGDPQAATKARDTLAGIFGPKLGLRLWEYGHAQDVTDFGQRVKSALARKSVGAEISWGVRAASREDVQAFVRNLCAEVAKRLACGGLVQSPEDAGASRGVAASESAGESPAAATPLVGSSVTVRVYIAKHDADPARAKAMGHGQCEIVTRTRAVPGGVPTRDAQVLAQVAQVLLDTTRCTPSTLRGLGVTVTRLENDSRKRAARPSDFFAEKGKRRRQVHIQEPGESPQKPPEAEPTKDAQTPRKQSPPIDWNTYYELPEDVRAAVRAEYALAATPRGLSANRSRPGYTRETRSAPPPDTRPASVGPALRREKQPRPQARQQQLLRRTARAVPREHDVLAHPSLLDPVTLGELPAHIAAELREAVQAHRGVHAHEAPAPTSIDLEAHRPEAYRVHAPVLDVDAQGVPLVRIGEVCRAVREWIAACVQLGAGNEAPHPADQTLLQNYVDALLRDPLRWPHAWRLGAWIKSETQALNAGLEWQQLAHNLGEHIVSNAWTLYHRRIVI